MVRGDVLDVDGRPRAIVQRSVVLREGAQPRPAELPIAGAARHRADRRPTRRALTRDRVGANDAKRLQYQIRIGGRFFHPRLIKILNVVRHVLAKLQARVVKVRSR